MALRRASSETVPMMSSSVGGRGWPRRRMAAGVVLGVAAAGVGLANVGVGEDPFRQCDRQCRDAYGFYDRAITGERTGLLGRNCACSRKGQRFGVEQPWRSRQAWNESFWCGNFSTSLVCASDPRDAGRTPRTTTREEAAIQGLAVLHCGECAACSTMQDLLVLNSTREFATLVVTRCATAYAKPKWLGGHRNVEQLRKCMREAGVGFSEVNSAAWAKPANKPSCMDCWTGARHRARCAQRFEYSRTSCRCPRR